MDTNLQKTLCELIEHSSHTSSLLIDGEIALNDGDLAASQKANMDAQALLDTMVKDIFVETRQALSSSSNKTDDYDLPSTLELAKSLAKTAQNAASLLLLIISGESQRLQSIMIEKVLTNINTVIEIYNAIFNN